jgi:hypothetical protein
MVAELLVCERSTEHRPRCITIAPPCVEALARQDDGTRLENSLTVQGLQIEPRRFAPIARVDGRDRIASISVPPEIASARLDEEDFSTGRALHSTEGERRESVRRRIVRTLKVRPTAIAHVERRLPPRVPVILVSRIRAAHVHQFAAPGENSGVLAVVVCNRKTQLGQSARELGVGLLDTGARRHEARRHAGKHPFAVVDDRATGLSIEDDPVANRSRWRGRCGRWWRRVRSILRTLRRGAMTRADQREQAGHPENPRLIGGPSYFGAIVGHPATT